MVLLVLLLLLLSFALFLTRRNRETGLILGLTAALTLHWLTVLIYIAKKGGITTDMETLLFGFRQVRHTMQYMLVTLKQLGFAMALGRYLFPLILVELALYYSYAKGIRNRPWLMAAACVAPAISLLCYYPPVFEWLIDGRGWMLQLLVRSTMGWIIAYLVLTAVLIAWEYRGISMIYYRRLMRRRFIMLLSLTMLYGIYCPQDPAQVYLFYRNEYMGRVQGLWYLNPALNVVNYLLVTFLVVVCSAIGFHALMRSAYDNIQEGQEDVAIQRKFDTASKGASVFVHSVKNQLLANRVVHKRLGQELGKDEPDMQKVREYQQMLAQANETMLKRMDELYHSVQNNFITLVPTPLEEVCAAAQEHFARKYPEAKLTATVPVDVLILCDRIHLAETIYNLLTNGYEAQIAAGRQDECLQLICQQERLWTVIEVRDRGNGITRQQRKHIYDPFYSSKNTNFNWGMGLYYVRATVKSHLGVLRVESRPGQGCSFFLQLPRYGSTNDLINGQGETT